jgi:hypothetical protein
MIQQIKDSNQEKAHVILKIIYSILKNVEQNPNDPKFRKLKTDNPKLKQMIIEPKGALELLKLAGFTIVSTLIFSIDMIDEWLFGAPPRCLIESYSCDIGKFGTYQWCKTNPTKRGIKGGTRKGRDAAQKKGRIEEKKETGTGAQRKGKITDQRRKREIER